MKNLLILFSIILFIGCNEKKIDTQKTDEDLLATPVALDENKNELNMSLLSKRYDSNLVEELFEEVLSKDKELKILMKNIQLIENDSVGLKTKSYKKYSNTNDKYWNDVHSYSMQIKDSVLKKTVSKMFEVLESDYRKKIADHEDMINEIFQKSLVLSDQVILLKLLLTQPLFSNYQRNEMPKKEVLQSVINDYDKLIGETLKYTKITK